MPDVYLVWVQLKSPRKIDLVISLEIWDPAKTYDRMGMENEYMNILGIDVPSITIPIKPGRNLAIILEVAAMNNRQKRWVIMRRRSCWSASECRMMTQM